MSPIAFLFMGKISDALRSQIAIIKASDDRQTRKFEELMKWIESKKRP